MTNEKMDEWAIKALRLGCDHASGVAGEVVVEKLVAVAQAAQEVANIEHLSLDPRFNGLELYRRLKKNLEALGESLC